MASAGRSEKNQPTTPGSHKEERGPRPRRENGCSAGHSPCSVFAGKRYGTCSGDDGVTSIENAGIDPADTVKRTWKRGDKSNGAASNEDNPVAGPKEEIGTNHAVTDLHFNSTSNRQIEKHLDQRFSLPVPASSPKQRVLNGKNLTWHERRHYTAPTGRGKSRHQSRLGRFSTGVSQ